MSCEGCPSKGSCSKDAASCQTKPNPNNHIRYIAAVMSGKGGVGKSTCTVLLARALAAQGKKVGIMDADITGPSIPRLMALEDEKAYATPDNQIIPIESQEGIKMISLNYMLPDENEPVIWRGPIVANVVKQFYTDVLWGDLDVLLIDMPPGTGDVALTILQELPVNGVVMISTPQPMVSMIVTKAIRMCEKMSIPVLGVIENMAYLNCPHCDEKILFYNEDELNAFLDGSNSRLYGTLPQVDLIRDINKYDTFTLREQEKVKDMFTEIASDVMEDLSALKAEGNA
ncbi:Mrp/NBP35 family ATP-binding protein [Ileibacterium valens]|uniref:Mrp/NBP35 family ATP-binding protein n=3 Tax=Ileibacterium valens TaxID=1862668 RepID=UPI00272C2EAD|nr:Mrp/NBP35 family ATP-binding protein [Ileibacterium valens]